MPPTLNENPFNQPPASAPPDTNNPSQPPKPRPSRTTKPKLTPAHFTNPHVIASALSIGRRYAARLDAQTHDPTALLSSFLHRMSQWSSQVAPHLQLPDFVIAAHALGGNRELKHFLANIRLAELRQVTDAWRTLQDEKRDKKKRKTMLKIEQHDSDHGQPAHTHPPHHPSLPSPDHPHVPIANADEIHRDTSHTDYRSSMMKDPHVLARIERNRQMALEKRRAAKSRNALHDAPLSSVVDKQTTQPGKPECMDIDLNDVVDPQEDVDLAVLDEMELPRSPIAHPQPCPQLPVHKSIDENSRLHKKQNTDMGDGGGALDSAGTALRDTTTKDNGKAGQANSPSTCAGQPPHEKDSTASAVVKTSSETAEAATEGKTRRDLLRPNIQAAPLKGMNHMNGNQASDSQGIANETDNAESGENKLAREDENRAPAAATSAATSLSPPKETEDDIDMDILQEFEAGASEDY